MRDKYILHIKNALSQECCIDLISSLEYSPNKKFNPHIGYEYIVQSIHSLPTVRDVLIKGSTIYKAKHPFLERRNVRWSVDRTFNIQKFSPKKYYGWTNSAPPEESEHCEHGSEDGSQLRMVVWMIYLNDIKKDGGTRWPQQNFTSKPRAGDLYIWPAGWTHSHHGIPAPKENKYLMTGWYSLIK